jgi:hypothetical protein
MADPPKPAPAFPERDPLEGFRDQRHERPTKDWQAILTGRKLPPDNGPLEPEAL